MIIEVGGVDYSGFTQAKVEMRLDALSASFNFEASSQEGVPLPFRGGEACKIYVDETLVLTGFIEVLNVDGDESEHTITFGGRDKTADLIDSSLGGPGPPTVSDIRGNLSLKRLCEIIIAHLQQSIKVVDKAKARNFDETEDWISPEIGDNAFDFLEKMARKREVFLGRNASGDLVITKGGARQTQSFIRHRKSDPTSNVLSYSVSYDMTDRFHVYRSLSQYNVVATQQAGAGISSSSIAGQGEFTPAVDAEMRVGRQWVVDGESMFSGDQDRVRAKWEKDVRRARGRAYGARVDGYRDQEGNLWELNTIVKVDDPDAGILNAEMLINSIEYELSEDQGSTTVLGLVEKDAYILEQNDPAALGDDDGLFG